MMRQSPQTPSSRKTPSSRRYAPVSPDTTHCDESQKEQIVFTVIEQCAMDPEASVGSDEKYEPLQVSAEHWDIREKDIAKVKQLYAAQVKVFYADIKTSKKLLQLLAVGRKLKAPYLLYLIDVYVRENIKADGKLTCSHFERSWRHFRHLKRIGCANQAGEAA